MMSNVLKCMLLVLSTSVALVTSAVADDWPERPITMIIMSKPGGGMDNASRLVGEQLASHLGQPIKYINRPGGSGRIALDLFLEEKPDGYTIFSGNIPTLVMMQGQRELDYQLGDRLAWMGAYLVDPALLLVSAKSDHTSISEFVASTDELPARVGVANWASAQTLALLQLMDMTNSDLEIIPYSGFKAAATALVGGHIEAAVGNFSATEKLGDEVRYLGIFNETAPDGSNIPPINEALNIDVIDAASIRALGVHAELAEEYPDRYAILEQTIRKVIDDPAFVGSFASIGADLSQAVAWGANDASAAAGVLEELLLEYEDLFEE